MYWLHQEGYSFNGDAPIAGLLKVEADALVLGKLMHDDPQRTGTPSGRGSVRSQKQKIRQNHREETQRMLDRLKN